MIGIALCDRDVNPGHSRDKIAKALEVAAAAEAVFESGFTKGFEHFDSLRAKYSNEPWYKDLHDNYTHLILPYSEAELREKGKEYVFGTPFSLRSEANS